VQESEEKGRERVDRKAMEDERVFIPGEGLGWQMRPGSTPCRRAVRASRGRQTGRGSPQLGAAPHSSSCSKPEENA
jgi:hypothetical protein